MRVWLPWLSYLISNYILFPRWIEVVLKECKSAMWQMKNLKKKLSMKSRSKETLYSNYLPKKATALAWASFRKISHDCFTNCALSFEYAFGVTTSLPGHAKNQNFSTKFIINLHTMVSKQPRINIVLLFPLGDMSRMISKKSLRRRLITRNYWSRSQLSTFGWWCHFWGQISSARNLHQAQWYSLCDDVA